MIDWQFFIWLVGRETLKLLIWFTMHLKNSTLSCRQIIEIEIKNLCSLKKSLEILKWFHVFFCFCRKWWNSVEFLHKSSTFLMPDFVHHFLSHHHVRSQLSSQLLFAVSNNSQLLLITSGLAIVNHLRKKFIFKKIEKLDEKLMRKRGFEGGSSEISGI